MRAVPTARHESPSVLPWIVRRSGAGRELAWCPELAWNLAGVVVRHRTLLRPSDGQHAGETL